MSQYKTIINCLPLLSSKLSILPTAQGDLKSHDFPLSTDYKKRVSHLVNSF